MTDQTESASENAELLAHLDGCATEFQGHPIRHEDAAAAIRALEAKVRGMSNVVDWLERDRDLWHSRAKINEDRADKYAAQSAYLLPALSEARLRMEADRDRLAGEVEEVKAEHAAMLADWDGMRVEVARLIAELAAARENEARYLWLRDAEWPRNVASVVTLQKNAVWDEVIDAARRAGGDEG